MKDSYRLLIAFLFILPATLVAQPDKETRPSISENIEQMNREISLKPAQFQTSMSLTADTVPKESHFTVDQDYSAALQQAYEGQQPVLPDSSSTASIKSN